MRWLAIVLRDTLVVWGVLFAALTVWAAMGDGRVVVPGWLMAIAPAAAWLRAEICGWHVESKEQSDG